MRFSLVSLPLLAALSPCVEAQETAETTCTTDLLLNIFTVLPSTTTVYKTTVTPTSSVPCGSCSLVSQVHYPGGVHPNYTATVTGEVGTSTTYVCVSSVEVLDGEARVTHAVMRHKAKRQGSSGVPAPSTSRKVESLPSSSDKDTSMSSTSGPKDYSTLSSFPSGIVLLSTSTAKANATETCTSISTMPTKLPSCFTFKGSLYRDMCPTKHSEIAKCPWLCTTFLFMGPPFLCSRTNISGPNPIEFGPSPSCQKCSSRKISTIGTVNLRPASSAIHGSTVNKTTAIFPTSTKIVLPSTVDNTKAHKPTTACISANPFGTDPPAVKAFENGMPYLYRFSCGASAATVAECPYICIRGPSNHTLQLCSNKDISDPSTNPVETRLVCEHCSPPGGNMGTSPTSSSSASPSATCTSIIPSDTLCPLVKEHAFSGNKGPLLQSRCGSTSAEVAACPFLCTTEDPAYIDLFECVNEDVSGKNTIFDETHIESCGKCLPPCSG